MITGLIVIFILGMAVVFLSENKKEIDKKTKEFKDILEK